MANKAKFTGNVSLSVAEGIYAKKGKYYVVVSKQVIVDGKKKQKRIWKPTGLDATKENIPAAKRIRRELQDDFDLSLSFHKPGTVNALCDEYIYKKRHLQDTTKSKIRNQIAQIRNYFGDIEVEKVNEEDIEEFFRYLAESGNRSQYKNSGQGLSERTIKDIRQTLSNIFLLAISERIIPAVNNPMLEAKVDKSLIDTQGRKSTNAFFNYEQARHFLEIVEEEDHPLKLLFYTTLAFGLRRSEVMGLKWSAIDFVKKEMSICSTVTIGSQINRRNQVKTETSNNEDAPFPLTDEQVEMFKNEKHKQEALEKAFGRRYVRNDYVFKHDDGTPYYPDYPSKALNKILKRHPELPQDVNFHGLRKSCASILVRQGIGPKDLQVWMRHKDIETTLKIYALVDKQEASRLVSNKVGSLFPPHKG